MCVQHACVCTVCVHVCLTVSDYTVNKCVYFLGPEWRWKGVLKHFVVRKSTDKCCNQIAVWRTMCSQNNELKSPGESPQRTINTTEGRQWGRQTNPQAFSHQLSGRSLGLRESAWISSEACVRTSQKTRGNIKPCLQWCGKSSLSSLLSFISVLFRMTCKDRAIHWKEFILTLPAFCSFNNLCALEQIFTHYMGVTMWQTLSNYKSCNTDCIIKVLIWCANCFQKMSQL